MPSSSILKNHKDLIIRSGESLTHKKVELSRIKAENKLYHEVNDKVTEVSNKLKMCEEDLFSHISALESLEGLYARIKQNLQANLEFRLTDTINTWYNENVDLKFKTIGSSSKVKNKRVKLIDDIKGVQLKGVTGDGACQTVGLLVAVCIARMRGLKFLLLDEPFSNFSGESAKKVPELLESIIGDMQIVLIENKETVLEEINAYSYLLEKADISKPDSKGTLIKEVINRELYEPVIVFETEEGE